MRLDGEITEVTSPPNKADRFKCVTIWVPQIEEHVEMTFLVEDFQKNKIINDFARKTFYIYSRIQV